MNGPQLTRLVIQHIKQNYNGFAVNIVHASKSGIPDVLACINGIFYGFEIKGHGDIERPLQTVTMHKIIAAGGKCGYVRSITDVDNIINNSGDIVSLDSTKCIL